MNKIKTLPVAVGLHLQVEGKTPKPCAPITRRAPIKSAKGHLLSNSRPPKALVPWPVRAERGKEAGASLCCLFFSFFFFYQSANCTEKERSSFARIRQSKVGNEK